MVATERAFAAGEALVSARASWADELFVIVEGSVRVVHGRR